MLKTVKKALDLDLEVKKVEISPSGRGFHIILEKDGIDELGCLIYRAMLFDDPYRLRYSLIKYGLKQETDICFERKAGRNSKEIKVDIEELKKMDVLEVEKLVEKYEKRLGNALKRVFLTIFEIEDEKEEEVRKVLQDIADRDESFRYRVYTNLIKDGKTKYVGVIFSPDKNTAHKRGMWFVSNVDGVNMYWVKEVEKKK